MHGWMDDWSVGPTAGRMMRRLFGRISYCMENGGNDDVQLDKWLARRMGS